MPTNSSTELVRTPGICCYIYVQEWFLTDMTLHVSIFHRIFNVSKFFAPFQKKKKILVFSNTLIPSYLLHKNIIRGRAERYFTSQDPAQALEFSVTLVTIDNNHSTWSYLELQSAGLLLLLLNVWCCQQGNQKQWVLRSRNTKVRGTMPRLFYEKLYVLLIAINADACASKCFAGKIA